MVIPKYKIRNITEAAKELYKKAIRELRYDTKRPFLSTKPSRYWRTLSDVYRRPTRKKFYRRGYKQMKESFGLNGVADFFLTGRFYDAIRGRSYRTKNDIKIRIFTSNTTTYPDRNVRTSDIPHFAESQGRYITKPKFTDSDYEIMMDSALHQIFGRKRKLGKNVIVEYRSKY